MASLSGQNSRDLSDHFLYRFEHFIVSKHQPEHVLQFVIELQIRR